MPEVADMPDCSSAAPRSRRGLQIRAPRADESLVAVPCLSEGISLARQNHQSLAGSSSVLLGKPLSELRQWARRDAFLAARDFTSQWAPVPSQDAIATVPWFVSGHQPTFFHPGVWVKNFFVGEFARRSGGFGLNLVVDNDLCGGSRLKVPVGTRREPRIESIPFDADRIRRPWEEMRVLDRSQFGSFADRVKSAVALWHFVPLLRDLWPAAVQFAKQSSRISDCLTAARNQCERRWGCANLELPLSRLCELGPFQWFGLHLLVNAPRFREVHNQALAEYRRCNRIRSRNHPVPELKDDQGAVEVPFWMWGEDETRRHRVFVRRTATEIELLDENRAVFATMPLTAIENPNEGIAVLQKLRDQGIRFRTRALSTTLFARLCLADLFLHGIGGAKYDEMTDRICERFYGVQPPGYLTVSATLHLPLGSWSALPADQMRLRQKLRELKYHADRELEDSADPRVLALLAEKRQLIEEQQSVSMARREGLRSAGNQRAGIDRFRRLQAVNSELAGFVEPQRQQTLAELVEIERQLNVNALLQDREYSLALFPAEKLQSYLERIRRF